MKKLILAFFVFALAFSSIGLTTTHAFTDSSRCLNLEKAIDRNLKELERRVAALDQAKNRTANTENMIKYKEEEIESKQKLYDKTLAQLDKNSKSYADYCLPTDQDTDGQNSSSDSDDSSGRNDCEDLGKWLAVKLFGKFLWNSITNLELSFEIFAETTAETSGEFFNKGIETTEKNMQGLGGNSKACEEFVY